MPFSLLVKINSGQEEVLFSIREDMRSNKVTQVLMQQSPNTKTKLFLTFVVGEAASDFFMKHGSYL